MSVRVVNFIINGESHMAIVKSSSSEFTYEDYMDASKSTNFIKVMYTQSTVENR